MSGRGRQRCLEVGHYLSRRDMSLKQLEAPPPGQEVAGEPCISQPAQGHAAQDPPLIPPEQVRIISVQLHSCVWRD